MTTTDAGMRQRGPANCGPPMSRRKQLPTTYRLVLGPDFANSSRFHSAPFQRRPVNLSTGPRFHCSPFHRLKSPKIGKPRRRERESFRQVPLAGGHPVLEVEARVLVHCIRSKLAHNVAQPNPQRLGDSQKGINGNRPFRPLHLADVNGVKVGLFSQFFLAETRLLPIFANIVANQSAVLWILGHSPLPKQNAGDRSHKLTALVFSSVSSCIPAASALEPVTRLLRNWHQINLDLRQRGREARAASQMERENE